MKKNSLKLNLTFSSFMWKTKNIYFAILFPILIAGMALAFDIYRPLYRVQSIVVMNEQIMVDLRVLSTYIKPGTDFKISGCPKIEESIINYKAEKYPYELKGELIVESRDLGSAVKALNLWHECSVNVFKRKIEPYEWELNIIDNLIKRIDSQSIHLKDINEFYKFRSSVFDYKLMNLYIKEPLLYKEKRADLNYVKYLTIYLSSLAVLCMLAIFVYIIKK